MIVERHLELQQPLETDPVLLKTILENLLDNAVKFSPFGASIHLKLWVEETDLQISVSDQGPGISEADQHTLFNKFARLSARPTAGESSNGLGLFIVKQFAASLKGSIHLEKSDQGACFRLSLPKAVKAHTNLSKPD